MKHRVLTLLVVSMMLLSLFSGCGNKDVSISTEPTEAVVPEPTTPADGDSRDVTCKGTYTAPAADVKAAADLPVAGIGDSKLTLSQLQLYYWLAVADYRMSGSQPEPDFTQSLDTQPCPLDSSVGSWQQYFLREALNTWHGRQALIVQGQEESLANAEYYAPDPKRHEEYLNDELPAMKYLYGYNESYQPNEQHQAYLDALPETLAKLASDNGFSGSDAQAAAIAGSAVTGEDLAAYADTLNRAYMYFTELGYHFEPTDEEIQDHYRQNQTVIDALGGEKTVDIRHILLLPENASVAADGTVTAGEADWAQCMSRAEDLVAQWQYAIQKTRFAQNCPNSVPEARFSELAAEHSADAGSAPSGGMYAGLTPGQLIAELDAWCFDEARQHGDYEILRAADGIHIVFFSAAREGWYAAAEEHLIRQLYAELVPSAMETYPMTVAYRAILLAQPEDNGSFVTDADLLYPDVAHERYPSLPLYLQQDFPKAPYNNWTVSSHGCGITTLAMLASYYTDEEVTPAELAGQYGYYCGIRGTEVVIFDDTPAELGFRLRKRSGDWDEIHNAILDGCVVVSLQHAGYWTRGGHYLAITEVTKDNKYVVRDSNIYNYRRVQAHKEDCHTKSSIVAAGQYYWIYEPKVTRIPDCLRCGDGLSTGAPEIFFVEDYLCPKCAAAALRHDSFLS